MTTREEKQIKLNNKKNSLIMKAEKLEAQSLVISNNDKNNSPTTLCEPIKIGHHSENKHRKMLERSRNNASKSAALYIEAQEIRKKVKNMQPVRMNGDAEARKAKVTALITEKYKVGDTINSCFYGLCEIVKVNLKTLKLKTPNGGLVLQEKYLF